MQVDGYNRTSWRINREALEKNTSSRSSTVVGPLTTAEEGRFRQLLSFFGIFSDQYLSAPMRWMSLSQKIKLVEKELFFPRLHNDLDGYRILLMSDLHFDGHATHARRLEKILKGVSNINLVAFTGDYTRNYVKKGAPEAIGQQIKTLVERIAPHDGAKAILGNHDRAYMADILEANGIQMLLNETTCIPHGEARLQVTGTDDVNSYFTQAACEAVRHKNEGDFSLVLVHSPELAGQAAAAGHDLYLCGHTHGGQIRLGKNRAPISTFMKAHQDLYSGFWELNGMTGYTSNGIGTNAPVPIRVYCPPDVAVLTIRAGI